MSDAEKLAALIAGWVIPAFIVAFTRKTKGLEKAFWVFTTVWGSWFTFGFYMLVAPLSGQEKTSDEDSQT